METMVQKIVIMNETARKANIIAERTGNMELGIMKSLMIDLLKEKMRNGIAHFVYVKQSNGYGEPEIREAWGTLQSGLMEAKISGRGKNKNTDNVVVYFDVIKGGFRSFRVENLIQVF